MLIQADAKQLEWLVINWLAQDPVGIDEILRDVDVHSVNQERFRLPERVIAKIFVFRLIYGGTEFSYANDPDFMGVSKSQKFWKEVIEKFYNKYRGIARQHADWVREATTTGNIVMPTGRRYVFTPYTNSRGENTWPRTKILNYPVQGLAADLMSIARVSLKRRLDALEPRIRNDIKLVSTVHDSIVTDVPSAEFLPPVKKIIHGVFEDIPSNFRAVFGYSFNLPLRAGITYGSNLRDLA